MSEIFDVLLTSEMLISLLTLTFMEIILGIDNIVFITIVGDTLPEKQRPKAINLGLLLAMVFRVALLFGLTWIISQTQSLFTLDLPFAENDFAPTMRDLILLGGGLFLLYKSVTEMHNKLEGVEEKATSNKGANQFTQVLMQMVLLNIVFSFDSILTAVGLVDTDPSDSNKMAAALIVMVLAVIISMGFMMLTIKSIGAFIEKHPTMKMLALSFLLLIGFMLAFEGFHSIHHQEIPKGTVYFAMFFSLAVEILNMRLRKKSKKPVQLHQAMVEDDKS